jgi:HD-like signal output (HDOD) protein
MGTLLTRLLALFGFGADTAAAGPLFRRSHADAPPAEERLRTPPAPEPLRATSIANFDGAPMQVVLVDWEDNLLLQIEQRVQQGRYNLPQLPSGHMTVMNMVNNPGVEMRDLVEAITRDPVLSAELLKMANSALYATAQPAETLQEAVVRIGLRGLRSVIFASSMRAVLFKSKDLQEFAQEVWRQSFSMACIARAIGPYAGIEAERAFVLGLLHDVGKVPLLVLLREGIPQSKRANLNLIGKTFARWHEQAGARLAQEWKLPADLESVIGCHHRYQDNKLEPRLAALCCLAHKLDLQLSMSAEREFRALAHGLEMDALGLQEEPRLMMLRDARKAFEEANQELIAAAAPAGASASGAPEDGAERAAA